MPTSNTAWIVLPTLHEDDNDDPIEEFALKADINYIGKVARDGAGHAFVNIGVKGLGVTVRFKTTLDAEAWLATLRSTLNV